MNLHHQVLSEYHTLLHKSQELLFVGDNHVVYKFYKVFRKYLLRIFIQFIVLTDQETEREAIELDSTMSIFLKTDDPIEIEEISKLDLKGVNI